MANRNSLSKRQDNGSFSSFMGLQAVKNKVYDIVAGKDGDRFITSIVTAVGTNPQLSDCDYGSILSAALLGESLRLSPSPQLGQFYMVPFNSKGGKKAQFQLGYKGYIQLAIRSGQYRDLDVICVKEGELIGYDPFKRQAEFDAIEDPSEREEAKTVGYFAYFELLNGFRKELYWTRKQMEVHAKKYSPGYKNDLSRGTSYTFWSKNFDGMAQKTMLRQLISKWGIMSIDMQEAYTGDMGIINEDGTTEYVEPEEIEISFGDTKEAEPIKELADGQASESPKDQDKGLPFNNEPPASQGQQSIEDQFFL